MDIAYEPKRQLICMKPFNLQKELNNIFSAFLVQFSGYIIVIILSDKIRYKLLLCLYFAVVINMSFLLRPHVLLPFLYS